VVKKAYEQQRSGTGTLQRRRHHRHGAQRSQGGGRAPGPPNHRSSTRSSLRRDQLDEYVQLGVNPSFFTNHAFFWGDLHVENLGKQRAYFSSPMKTARALGLHMTNHSDFL